MTTVSKYTTPGAAGLEVHARAERYIVEHQGSTYREAWDAVLASDKQLAQAYAAPVPRRKIGASGTPISKPAVPIAPGDEAEIAAWVTRAITDGKVGSLPGALGQLSVEADRFAKIGMPVAEAARRAMDLFPHLVSLAKLLLVDVRRNDPEDKPEAGTPGSYAVHARAEALQQKHPHMDYRECVGAVLSEDPALKQRYAGVQS